jgi:PEP-CTERM motif-containing protein
MNENRKRKIEDNFCIVVLLCFGSAGGGPVNNEGGKNMRARLSRLTLWVLVAGASFLISLAAGPAEGDLFVSSEGTNQVLEYTGTMGAFDKAFVSAGSGGLFQPTFLTFSPSPSVPVPEPSALSLMSLGFLGMACARRSRRPT